MFGNVRCIVAYLRCVVKRVYLRCVVKRVISKENSSDNTRCLEREIYGSLLLHKFTALFTNTLGLTVDSTQIYYSLYYTLGSKDYRLKIFSVYTKVCGNERFLVVSSTEISSL